MLKSRDCQTGLGLEGSGLSLGLGLEGSGLSLKKHWDQTGITAGNASISDLSKHEFVESRVHTPCCI